ncbi:MAG: hypothetical protein ACYSOF_01990 [Planctomycetota bacterium]|jgi:hypothetical protein
MSENSEQLPTAGEESGGAAHAHAEQEETKAERREPPDETPTVLDGTDGPLKRDRSACADALLPSKTQGVKPPRDSGVGVLQSAAKKAARSNSRADVYEYMRLRRNFV